MKIGNPTKSLQDKLEKAISFFHVEAQQRIKKIAMHPDTFHDLLTELNKEENFYITVGKDNRRVLYRGIEVMRSFDVDKNEFEIL
jgi:hypothetical protein